MFDFLKDLGFPAYVAGVMTLISIGYKQIKEFQERNLKSTKEQLDTMAELFLNSEKLSNKFLVEQVFQYKFKTYIPHNIITLLLKTKNPTSSLKDYIFARRYLKFDTSDSNVSYTKKMVSHSHRKMWYIIYVAGYFVFAFLGLGCLFYLDKINKHLGFSWMIVTIPLIFYFLFVAYEFLMSSLRIKAAENIMKEVELDNAHNNRVNSDDKPPPKKLTPSTNLGEVENGKNQGAEEGPSVQ